ncbi:nickel-dependent hydrogenase large subunit [Thermodesulfovibrio thiophilus]|uniref:nickel-dependent hydrogenase large subunit n=1 Tax=Thermodesulfovibrio thiophilus TaxID=340095 RepID=UPI00040A9557|nr:nickel-dependent hydrogenase large subunit [Thermodesulfovibrio thiophilus]HOA83715.1 nickel-dependent hydrogenase large subunit [Thermodesulfovibrio thiophilus]
MARLVIDPVTRIEGHLRVEATVSDGKVKDAYSSCTMWRGMEIILKGKDPRDAWAYAQRACGVCTTVHAIASVRAVEDAIGAKIPENARILRNIIMANQNVQDHIIHFYHLHALDWVDVVSALKADPQKTSELAKSISSWPKNSATYFKAVQDKVKAFVESGQLGIFSNGYWGHPAYKLPPEANLMAVAHYLEALDIQREIIKIQVLLGSKNPHPQTFIVGGQSTPVDPESQNALNADSIAFMLKYADKAIEFVEKVYIPDLLAVASFYKDWAGIGGFGNFLVYGDYPDANGKFYFPGGVIINKNLAKIEKFDHKKFKEYITHSWYKYSKGENAGLHPWEGETTPNYTGPKPPYEYLNVEGKYSWGKAIRYDELPMEVGPLARVLVAYASGHHDVKEVADMVLKKLGVGPEALFSTLGRTAARGIETLLMAKKTKEYILELAANMKKGDTKIADTDKWNPKSWPKECQGVGFHEAPRGCLAHFVVIKDAKIANYQMVVPSTWNLSPRDHKGQRSPVEEALVGTPVADSNKPLELLRTIHSYDPCMACGMHTIEIKEE